MMLFQSTWSFLQDELEREFEDADKIKNSAYESFQNERHVSETSDLGKSIPGADSDPEADRFLISY